MSNTLTNTLLMDSAPVYLDVNIPMYAAGGEHPYKAPCMWCMDQIASGMITVVINVEILQEILHRYMSLGRLQTALDICEQVSALSDLIYPVDAADMRQALSIARKGPASIRARDCVHIATMRRYGIPVILSTDGHFDNLLGITRLDPLVLFQGTGAGDR